MVATAAVIERLTAVLKARGDAIATAYLFGSVGRGTATATSDVDVGVLFSDDPPATLAGLHLALEAELERAAGVPVQLVVLNRAPCDLVHRVLRDGLLLLDRDRSRRIRFEVSARNTDFDLKPYLDRYRRAAAANPPVTDPELAAKKLAQVETSVAELRALARLDQLDRDVKEQRFVEHTRQIAIQAALDVASHIVSDERLGEPRTNRELFRLLGRRGILSTDLVEVLEEAAGFRNVLVHGYDDVDLGIVRDVVEHRLDDLLAFVAEIRRWMAT